MSSLSGISTRLKIRSISLLTVLHIRHDHANARWRLDFKEGVLTEQSANPARTCCDLIATICRAHERDGAAEESPVGQVARRAPCVSIAAISLLLDGVRRSKPSSTICAGNGNRSLL